MSKHPLKEKADSMAAKLSMITKELSTMPSKNSLDKLAEEQQLMMIMEDEIINSQKEKHNLLLQIRKTKIEIEELQRNIKNTNQICQENEPSLIPNQDALMYPDGALVKNVDLLSINDQSLLMSVGTSLQVEQLYENNTTDNNDNSLRAKNIERLVNFTKINFLKVYNNLTVTDGDRIRYYNYMGNSYDINFFIEFEVNETNLVIRRLKIKLDSGFIEYARLNHQRKLLFGVLKRKYPTLTLPSLHTHNSFTQDSCLCVDVHSSLRFSEKSKIGPELILSWNLNITSSGHVLLDVEMHARMPHQWTLLDEKHVINQIPSNFQNLVEVKGIQSAIEMI
ncbi:14186_t:CDS:2 [Rhizophagus irregularis]|nr:14186_t:CDS:2 [Rhizophagus irregularis]